MAKDVQYAFQFLSRIVVYMRKSFADFLLFLFMIAPKRRSHDNTVLISDKM